MSIKGRSLERIMAFNQWNYQLLACVLDAGEVKLRPDYSRLSRHCIHISGPQHSHTENKHVQFQNQYSDILYRDIISLCKQ